MRVGFVGLGKLGLPVATAMASRGLDIWGFDPHVDRYPDDLSYEQDFAETAAKGRVRFASLTDVVRECSVIFCAVQTPHEPRFEGVTPLPDDRADFDYTQLRAAVGDIAQAALAHNRHITLAVISTVLPGTMEREIRPLLNGRVRLAYNPSFIAMGTTIRDFLNPEFVLIGGDSGAQVEQVYDHVFRVPYNDDAPKYFLTSVRDAELVKVAYNTFIGLKLAFANTLMEVCHKTGCDVDEVTDALKLADRRLISGAYLTGGMGDGGGCHPRDNIALSWLARELDLSYDLFEATMLQRERQAEWLADLMEQHLEGRRLLILGVAYKPGSHITTGSPARLVKNILEDRGHYVGEWDPYVHSQDPWVRELRSPDLPYVALIGCDHPAPSPHLPEGSVVIDPWRKWPDQDGIEVIRIGERAPAHDGTTRESRELRQAA